MAAAAPRSRCAHVAAASHAAAAPRRAELTVAVGISGGVDSAVAAHLLVEQGYRVVGLHVRSWDEKDETGQCSGEADLRDAQHVCASLGIPLTELDLVNEYWLDVFEPFLVWLESGYTPNPDLPCNVHVKFGPMWEYARRHLGADMLATGHYARLVQPAAAGSASAAATGSSSAVQLARAADETKDQSYFLATVAPAIWSNVLFPLGEIRKEAVRELADELGLRVADKKSSTGLCFVGKRRFDDFIGQYLTDRPGEIRSVEDGSLIEDHKGLWRYTVGQGARVGGGPQKLFVAGKDTETQTLWVAPGRGHPALYCTEATTFSDVTWATACGQPPAELLDRRGRLRCRYKVRYSQSPLGWCDVELVGNADSGSSNSSSSSFCNMVPAGDVADQYPASGSGSAPADEKSGGGLALRLHFLLPQRAVTPGQAVVLYGPLLSTDADSSSFTPTTATDDAVIGSATIAFPGESLYEGGHTAVVAGRCAE